MNENRNTSQTMKYSYAVKKFINGFKHMSQLAETSPSGRKVKAITLVTLLCYR